MPISTALVLILLFDWVFVIFFSRPRRKPGRILKYACHLPLICFPYHSTKSCIILFVASLMCAYHSVLLPHTLGTVSNRN